jgi:hypothetical protein
MSEFDETRQAAFIERLARMGRSKVPIATVRDVFSEVFPDRPPNAARATLASLLSEASQTGSISLPKTRGAWDRALQPPLPKFVLLPQEELPAPPRRWKERAWHASLEWITELAYLTAGQEAFLSRVNEGLVHGWFTDLAPMKYRSLQLTGHEKKLQAIQATKLFGPGRLSLAQLGCEPDTCPMVIQRLGESSRMLVVENAGAYHVARRVLARMHRPPYGIIGFGGGNRLPNSLPALREVQPAVDAIHYLGDLDWEGLAIAARGRRVCGETALPLLAPPPGFHAAMLAAATAFGAAQGWEGGRAADDGEQPRLLEHVPPDVRAAAGEIVKARRRIPEEVLGPAEMSRALTHVA